ncbi:probable methyltransferase At1g29790 [Impatiens glandulifera]|uniref:probable methyltransferase At1g29790 n=1 Tax=Impatiens glandulifera TaxID=253017 RepID=UPI001FB0C675|nr:probable methyltransferase At1g29790 [Impatiens glandulifera]
MAMGSVSLKIGDGTARFKKATICSSALNLVMLFFVLITNLFALYAFTSTPKIHNYHSPNNISIISEQVSLILREIDSSQKKLAQMEKQFIGFENIDLTQPKLAKELNLFLQRYQLPLGKDSKTGIKEMVSSVGHFCEKSMDSLSQFMNYKVNKPCPDDWSFGEKLILKGCEPLPRRRCFSKSIPKVNNCNNNDCFDHLSKTRGKNGFLIDDVLALGSNRGGIRTGLDLGGGSATFAAKMAEKNVTVITSTLNNEGPFSIFMASRGLFPLYTSLDQRFPFYDNVFDLVHVVSVLDVGESSSKKLEFLMFDVDRVLRAGGLFWLDSFDFASDDKKSELISLIERFGYKKLKWVVGEKKMKSKASLSAVLEKPVRL